MTFRLPLLLALVMSTTTLSNVNAWIVSNNKNNMNPAASASLLQASTVETAVSAASTSSTTTQRQLSTPFQMAVEQTLQQLRDGMPEQYASSMLPLLTHFVQEYMTATEAALRAGGDATICAPEMTAQRFLQAIHYGLQFGIVQPYQFDVTHRALRGKQPHKENGNTIDYYAFGCDFFRPVMDLEQSVVLGQDNLEKAMQQVAAGENVVLFANHQSEADPQVVSCCLEKAGYDQQAQDMVYVAGHKVTTDPLAIPFSMGRNLICIHSKKHIDSDPETKPAKQRQNLKSMNALLEKFKAGGCLLWVAPSGGRDRRNVETGDIPIAPFDRKTIDIFRLMGNKSKVKTHYYTLGMVSYNLCPPPDFVEAGVGEERNVRFVPVGIAMGDEVESVGGLEGRKEFRNHAMEQCERDYAELLRQVSAKEDRS